MKKYIVLAEASDSNTSNGTQLANGDNNNSFIPFKAVVGKHTPFITERMVLVAIKQGRVEVEINGEILELNALSYTYIMPKSNSGLP